MPRSRSTHAVALSQAGNNVRHARMAMMSVQRLIPLPSRMCLRRASKMTQWLSSQEAVVWRIDLDGLLIGFVW